MDQLDEQQVAVYCYNKKGLHKYAVLIPLKIHYRYKRDKNVIINAYKARCAVRGDKMVKYKQYNPEEVNTFTTDKTRVRFMLSLAANRKVELEHYDISSALTHERLHTKQPIYVLQERRFDGSLKHAHP